MKMEFRVFGLSYSQNNIGSYILILSQVDNDKLKIPIIIKQAEAIYYASKIEGININNKRPGIYDLSSIMIQTLGGDIREVYIYDIVEGVFIVDLILTSFEGEVRIPCNVGDAVAMSFSFGCPIFISEKVILNTGISINDDGTVTPSDIKETNKSKAKVSIESLEIMLQKAIENEEYEVASQIRDKIKGIK